MKKKQIVSKEKIELIVSTLWHRKLDGHTSLSELVAGVFATTTKS